MQPIPIQIETLLKRRSMWQKVTDRLWYAKKWLRAKWLAWSFKRHPLIPGEPKVPVKGYAWNPLIAFPRNQVCWCGSGKKAKKCCLLLIKRVVTEKQAKFLKGYMQMAVPSGNPKR